MFHGQILEREEKGRDRIFFYSQSWETSCGNSCLGEIVSGDRWDGGIADRALRDGGVGLNFGSIEF